MRKVVRGGVNITTNNLNLTAGGQVDASTLGTGNAGVVNITARGDVTADGEDSVGFTSGITSGVNPDAEGSSGGVTITTNNLNLTAGGRVSATTFGTGNAGVVNITARGDVTADGESSVGFTSDITSWVDPDGEGSSGGVTITTNNLNLTAGGRVSATTLGTGNAGAVNITARGDVTADGENSVGFSSGIASGVNTGAEGSSGGVTITTNNLNLTAGGRVNASTFGTGNAGNVTINANESISIDGFIERFRSGISANAQNENGNGGNILLDTGNLTIANGGTIEATNFDNITDNNTGTGQPGNINITVNSAELTNSARIEAATQFEGEASGIINLNVTEDITLRDNSFVSARAFSNADGGNLNIDARYIVAFDSIGTGNDLIATADGGTGGVIDLSSVEAILGLQPGNAVSANNQLIQNNTDDIDASSNISGQDGTVALDSGALNPIQGASELTTNVVVPEEITQQACSDRKIAAQNSFGIEGRGGIIPEPGLPLNPSSIYVDGESDSASSIPAPIETTQGKVQLARGIEVSEDDTITLTAYSTDNAGDRLPEKRNCKLIYSLINQKS